MMSRWTMSRAPAMDTPQRRCCSRPVARTGHSWTVGSTTGDLGPYMAQRHPVPPGRRHHRTEFWAFEANTAAPTLLAPVLAAVRVEPRLLRIGVT